MPSWLVLAVSLAVSILVSVRGDEKMSEITQRVADLESGFTGLLNDFGIINTGIGGLEAQVKDLTAKLTAGQTLSDEDKAALDKLASDFGTLKAQADNIAAGFNPPAPTPPAGS